MAQSTGLGSVDLLIFQYIIAVAIMFIFAFFKDRSKLYVTKTELAKLAVLGIVGNTFMTLFYYKAFEFLNVAAVTMLLFTYPIMVFVYSLIFKKQKVGLKKIAAMLMAFIGCTLTLNVFSNNTSYCLPGIFFGLLSAVFYAFMNVYSDENLKHTDSLAINAYSTLFSLIVILIYRQPKVLLEANINTYNLLCILALAVICEVIPLTLLYRAIKSIGALKVSVIGNLEIPTAILMSIIILREPVSIFQIIGAAIIIYSVHIIRT